MDTPAAPAAKTLRSEPPTRLGRARAWLMLALLMAAASVPLLAGLGTAPVLDSQEAAALATSQETWQRQAERPDDGWIDRLLPVQAGEPILDKAPGTTWVQVLAWWPADVETASAGELAFRARLVSVGMVLLTLGAAFWAGFSLGGLQIAALTGLIILANPLLTVAGRTATEDVLVLGWTTLAGAAALWAMRPMKPAAALPRQALGWAVCGGALGLTALCGGTDAVLPATVPLCVLVLLCPRRPGNTLGLAAAAGIALLLVTPWILFVHRHDPAMWRDWAGAISPEEALSRATLLPRVTDRLGMIATGWGMWTLLIAVALIWPFSATVKATDANRAAARSAEGKKNVVKLPGLRRRLLVGWGWLVGVLLLVVLAPPGMTTGVLLVAVPVGAVAAAQTVASMGEAALAGRTLWLWRLTATPTAAVVLLASVIVPLGMWWQPELVEADYLSRVVGDTMNPWYWSVTAVVLVGLALAAGVLVLGDRPARATCCWAGWSLVATTVVMISIARGPGVGMVRLEANHDVEALGTPAKVTPPDTSTPRLRSS